MSGCPSVSSRNVRRTFFAFNMHSCLEILDISKTYGFANLQIFHEGLENVCGHGDMQIFVIMRFYIFHFT